MSGVAVQAFPTSGKIVDGRTGRIEVYEDGHLVSVVYGRPSRVQPGMSCASADDTPTIHHSSDAELVDRVVYLRRRIEDDERRGRDTPADHRDLQVTRALQRARLRLRWRYNARDAYGKPGNRGTDVESECWRTGGLPSYALAFTIDRQRFLAGKSSVIRWSR